MKPNATPSFIRIARTQGQMKELRKMEDMWKEGRKLQKGREGTEGQGAYRNNHCCVAEQRPTEKEHPCQGNGQVCIVSRPGTA